MFSSAPLFYVKGDGKTHGKSHGHYETPGAMAKSGKGWGTVHVRVEASFEGGGHRPPLWLAWRSTWEAEAAPTERPGDRGTWWCEAQPEPGARSDATATPTSTGHHEAEDWAPVSSLSHRAHRRQQSDPLERGKVDAAAVAGCGHAGDWVWSSNQYSDWAKCPQCGLRMQYAPKPEWQEGGPMRTRHGFEPQEIRTVVISTRPAKPLKTTRRKQCAGHTGPDAATPGMEEMDKLASSLAAEVKGSVSGGPSEEETAS